jgi:type I restriction enzyme S subunit
MARSRSHARKNAGFSTALRCLIRQWRALEPWIASEDAEHRHSHHPATPLLEIMSARREAVIVNGSFGDWSPITVHLDGRISVRDRSHPYRGQMFAAYPGDIVFSKIDARSGAIGVLQADIPKAVVTSEFPVFVPNPEKLDGRFVQLVLRTGGFLKALRAKATGTSGRKRITPGAFIGLRIPLPSIDEQQTIVAAYDAALADAATKDGEAVAVEANAATAFETALGFGPPLRVPDRPIFVASFKDLDRWSHEAVRDRAIGGAITTTTWPTVRLDDVVADLENGWSPQCLARPAKPGEWGVLKLGAVSFGSYDEKQNKALPPHLKPRVHLEVKAGQVLISRANISRLVGATASIRETRPRLLLCDKIFRMVWQEPSPVIPDFVTEVLRISDVRRQIESKLTGTSPTMKNISKPALLSLTFPLPPLDDQRVLIAALDHGRAQAARLRSDAAVARANAWTAFESAVYTVEAAPSTVEADAAWPIDARISAKGPPSKDRGLASVLISKVCR